MKQGSLQLKCLILLSIIFIIFTTSVSAFALNSHKIPFNGENDTIFGIKADIAPVINGIADDEVWAKADWTAIDQLWLGNTYSSEDFTGRFKIAWTEGRLYLLAEITDNVLYDYYTDPLSNYHNDDCLEIFIDENHSGGEHTYNFNAFAYHVSTLLDVCDAGTDSQSHLFNDHIKAKWTKSGTVYTWELEIKVFPDTYSLNSSTNQPVSLYSGKILGMSAAYCDNDGGIQRENFIGSQVIEGADKNISWINASVFGTLKLVDSEPTAINAPKANNAVVTVYPNPSSNFITLDFESNSINNFLINIYTVDGKLFQSISCIKNKQAYSKVIDISNMPSGIVNIEITSTNYSKRFTVIKE